MSRSPLVSVIIPLYNQKQYVAQAIDSILGQTYPHIQVVVVNDGSSDDPHGILGPYLDRVILIDQENRGLAAARNSGIEKASGQYLQFLDADDFLHPQKIELQLAFMEENKKPLSYGEILQYDDASRQSSLRYVGPLDDMFSSLYNFWNPYPLPVHGLLVKSELINRYGPFENDLTACEDRYFFSRLAAAGIEFAYFPFIGGWRRIHGTNMNKDRSHIVTNVIRYYKKLNNYLGDDFFMDKYGYDGYRMMCANLTYIYRGEIARGAPRTSLKRMRRLIKEAGLVFCTAPIPKAKGGREVSAFLVRAHLGRIRRRLGL